MIIAVDGPAASGKGTLAAGLARHFGLPYLDTGLLYRAVGKAAAPYEGAPEFEAKAIAAAKALDPKTIDRGALLSQEVGSLASKVGVIPQVRAALFEAQRRFALQPGGAVLDGRDIGTRIAPEADVKIFLKADSKSRMERRARQFEAQGLSVNRYALFHQIEERDARDLANPAGAFYPATDAHLLDTTQLDIDAALRAAIAIVEAAREKSPGAA